MDALHIIAVRLAPALASGLVSVGVATNHAEIIALGAVTTVAVAIEAAVKWFNKKKGV